ncbi:MAG: GNAT family N-acetyltransferase [Deltaproteobacteria bacterium]|nr:GNAT family N-acetyltransferase [Deltaproteobacteria bacterium]
MLAIAPRADLHAAPLLSQRVTLLPIDVADVADLWDAVDQSRAWLQRWLAWVPMQTSAQEAQHFAEASVWDWDQGRALRFVVRELPRRPLVGLVSLESCVGMHRSCELGYWLRQDATGRGLATEAARLCLDFAFGRMGAHRVRVSAAASNHASLRVIARLGFHFEGIARHTEWCDGRWLDHAVFALLDHEWPGARSL